MLIKRLLKIVLPVLLAVLGICGACGETKKGNNNNSMNKDILFINGSPNKNGNTAHLAEVLLKGYGYETLNLCDYQINFYGQNRDGDELDKIVARMKKADIVVMGSPVYWHNICASMRTLMERFYGYIPSNEFAGKQLIFLYQGEAPTKMMIDDGEYTMNRFAQLYGFSYVGMANNDKQAEELRSKL